MWLPGLGTRRGRRITALAAAAVLVAAALLVAVRCGGGGQPAAVPATTTAAPPATTTTAAAPPAETPSVSPFTGLPAPPAPVLAVKIDNVRLARPQLGLTAADLVYVEPVEGGLSRLVAVFASRLPAAVGPVRSARESDLELLRQFGTPALGYSGAAPALLPQLAAARVVNVSPAQAPGAYYREPGRRAPHNLFARPAQLLAAAPGASPAASIGLRFGEPAAGGEPAVHEAASYPAAHWTFDWSAGEGRWLAGVDGAPLLAAEGGQAGAATVVLQTVAVRPSGISDALGNVSPFAQTVGSGPALVLRDGLRFAAQWSRPSADAGTEFTLPGGQPCPFARGPVWVVLVPAAG